MMRNATRIKIAALTTALALGGLTAAGLATRGDSEAPRPAPTSKAGAANPEPTVVHRRKVKTVVAKPDRGLPAGASSVAPAKQTRPATVAVPESLGSLRSDDEDDDERGAGREAEHERESDD